MDNAVKSQSRISPHGGARERATEAFWKGSLSLEELNRTGAELRKAHWLAQKQAGIDLIPSNDFSFYDQMLDMSCLLGNVPPRFQWDGGPIDLALRFKIARGTNETQSDCSYGGHSGAVAGEMTKWFDTNYHYIVSEFHRDTGFKIGSTKPFDEFSEALALGITTKPVLIGPLTFLFLGKSQDEGFDRLSLLARVLPVYAEVLQRLAAQRNDSVRRPNSRRPRRRLRPFAGATKSFGRRQREVPYLFEPRENVAALSRLPVILHLG
jgi:5-methyltetrahydropteroyltriglutamate--homocysteine methyltransferase